MMMSPTIGQAMINDIPVLCVCGPLKSDTACILDEALSKLTEYKLIVLNMQQCDYITSAAISVLLKALTRLIKAGGQLILTKCNDVVKQVLQLTGINRLEDVTII